MSAPLDFFSGAAAAQTGCATGEFHPTGKPSGARTRHCAFASGAAQQAGDARSVEVESAQEVQS